MVTDLWLVLMITTACCLTVGAVGMVALRSARARPVRTLLVIAALIPVSAVAVAVGVNVQAMVISSHDSTVVLVALASGVLLAVVLALTIGRWLVAGSEAVGARLRDLGVEHVDQPSPAAEGQPAPAELASLVVELEATRRRLQDSHRRERTLEQGRRELVAFMSHDLRTPLAGLRALTEGLEDGVVRDVPGALSRTRQLVDRMSGLVDDLFELSRLSAAPPRAWAPVSVSEVAEDVVGEAFEQARLARVHVRADMEGHERLAVLGAGDDLVRAVANLVSNAVRHTPPGGCVRVVGHRTSTGRVGLSVLDECGGIPDDHLARVFDVGWRGGAARTPGDGGAGLGLAISREVVEAHHGTLTVANTDTGCSFDITLPAS